MQPATFLLKFLKEGIQGIKKWSFAINTNTKFNSKDS